VDAIDAPHAGGFGGGARHRAAGERGIAVRSLERLFAVAPGFDAAHLLTMQCSITVTGTTPIAPGTGSSRRPWKRCATFPASPRRRSPALLPLSGDQNGVYGASFEDGRSYDVFRYVMTPGYCQTMGIALRRGRLLDEHDAAGAPPAVLIGESLAKSQFPGQDPIGKRMHVGPGNGPWYTIVGVVGDVKQGSLAEPGGCVYTSRRPSRGSRTTRCRWWSAHAMT
jgi:putative ABC transport system permease protein